MIISNGHNNPPSVGNNNFDKNTSNFTSPFFLEEYSDYLPIGIVTGNNNTAQGLSLNASYGSSVHKLIRKMQKQYPGIYRLDKQEMQGKVGRVNSLGTFVTVIKGAIANFQKPVEGEIVITDRHYSRAKYDDLVTTFFDSMIRQYYFQSTKGVIVGGGYVYHMDSKDFIFCIVVPTKMIKYFKLSFMTKGLFPTEGMEFWVKKDFDSPRTLYKGFRSAYRKLIKPKIEGLGIPIIEKSGNISNEMMPVISIPESIDELRRWKEEIAAKTLRAERENLTFSF